MATQDRPSAVLVPVQTAVILSANNEALRRSINDHALEAPWARTQERKLATGAVPLSRLAQADSDRGYHMVLVMVGLSPHAPLDVLVAEAAKRDGAALFLTDEGFDLLPQKEYTQRVKLTEAGEGAVVEEVEAGETEGKAKGGMLFVRDRGSRRVRLAAEMLGHPHVLAGLVRPTGPPILPIAVRALTLPIGPATRTVTASMFTSAFAPWAVTGDVRVAKGTRLFHQAGFCDEYGSGSHTNTLVNRPVFEKDDPNRRVVAQLGQMYPMAGAVALSTRRIVRASHTSSVTHGMYAATRDLGLARDAFGGSGERMFLHAVAHPHVRENDDFAERVYELSAKLSATPEVDDLCLLVWDAVPASLGVIDGSVPVTVVFFQSDSAKVAGFAETSKNLFTCADDDKYPPVEMLYTVNPKFETVVNNNALFS